MTKNPVLANRRHMLLWGAAAVSAAVIPGFGRADDIDTHDDYDDHNTYGQARNARFELANTGLKGRVVVIGGGMAGATAAKYLRLWGGADMQVTLVEPRPFYTSNIMSNLVLNNSRSLSSLAFGYTDLSSKYGVVLKTAAIMTLDTAARQVSLSDGSLLSYDRLVLAPGVEFMNAYGLQASDYDSKTPHAWSAGPQTALLRQQLADMPADGLFVLTIPKMPYRCPPGPYERACLVADHVKRVKGAGAKVMILDENTSIQAEVETFTQAFNSIHAGVIDYRPGVSGMSIDPDTRIVRYTDPLGQSIEVQAQVVNPIPPHRAAGSAPGGWLDRAGLNNSMANGQADGRWCVVDVLSYESTAAPGVHVIGDAASCGLPKAGHVANQEAKICADAIIRAFGGLAPDPSPVASSACYSPITASTASWLTAVYQYDSVNRKMVLAANGGQTQGARATESASISSSNYREMGTWFNSLMGDSLG